MSKRQPAARTRTGLLDLLILFIIVAAACGFVGYIAYQAGVENERQRMQEELEPPTQPPAQKGSWI